MADSDKKHPKDMSIDELSAAIDEHVSEVGKKPATKTKTEPPAEEPVPKATSVKAEDASKISIGRSSYISKAEEARAETPEAAPKKPGENSMLSKKKVVQPINEPKKAEDTKTAAAPATPGNKIDMMFKQQETPKPQPPAADKIEKPVEKTPQKTAEPEPQVEKSETKTTTDEPSETKKPDQEKGEDKPIETEKKAESVESKEVKPKAEPGKGDNYIDKLARQIETKEDREKQAKEKEAKNVSDAKNEAFLFDSKQYHIPIKAKNHRRRGNAVNIFLAMLAAALATLYVLNELEIIDLVDMFLAE